MSNSKLYPLIYESNVEIYALKNSHFTIGTSPYYAHQNAVGIDIYEQMSIENYEVISPVSGKVLQIKEMQAPKPRFKGGIDNEYLIIIQNPNSKNTVYKILHIKSELDIGQKIKAGDYLGITIRNGYFAPWSSPHIHLELKEPRDVLRAKRGLSFPLNTHKDVISDLQEEIPYKGQIPIKIEYKCEEFFLARFPEDLYYYIKPFYGVKGTSGKLCFILDGGIPQYKHGIIHFKNDKDPQSIQQINLNGVKIGTLSSIHGNYGFVKFTPVEIIFNDTPIRGISLFLANFHPLIKFIPFHRNDFEIKENATYYLKIRTI
ncbi:MAG: M23 family metallopeptidase [Candidatus Thorarchaeota archaeon]